MPIGLEKMELWCMEINFLLKICRRLENLAMLMKTNYEIMLFDLYLPVLTDAETALVL